MQPGDYLRFSTTGAGQLQLAVKDANWTWLQFSPFYDLVGKDFDVKVEGTDYNKMTTAQIVDNLKLHGLFVKGTNHTLYGMKIMRPGQGGVEGIADDDAIDWNAPVEIYNLQGIRVAEASKGGIYIIRQGEKSVKVRK